MSDNHRTARASFSGPEDFIEEAKEYAEDRGLSFSRLIRLSLEHTMVTDGVEIESGYWERREGIKDRNRFAQNKAFFLDRVSERLTELFTSRAKPKEIMDVARGYVEEAEEIEGESKARDNVTDYADGELVREVKYLVRETLEAQNLTNWDKRYTNRLERFEGVEDGVRRKQFTLVLAQNAMRKDDDLEPIRSLANSERRVRGEDLPDLADDELPGEIDREQVARVARRLIDQGVAPDDLPTDPFEFIEEFGGGSFGWHVVDPDETALEPGAEPDANAGATIAADGGDFAARGEHDDAQTDPEDELDDEHEDEQDTRDLADLVTWAEKELRERSQTAGTDRSLDAVAESQRKKREREQKEEAREKAEEYVKRELNNAATWKHEIMQNESLTPDDVIEAADNYHEAVWNDPGAGDVDPAAVVGGEQA